MDFMVFVVHTHHKRTFVQTNFIDGNPLVSPSVCDCMRMFGC
ncbi:hypothetical protein J2736_003788 [Paenibacillus qinlingensis]|uniref:Uncharacterized protein n=1 Tax=Paenibacillus qinlingensis TaxID=1837343 RepID=A0ABU1NYK2_9BACL|nr:hypothetical protein [Paenibacillus qinlingensis]